MLKRRKKKRAAANLPVARVFRPGRPRRPRRPPAVQVDEWRSQAQLLLAAHRGPLTMTVSVFPLVAGWGALAVESAAKTLDGVLEQHSHRTLAENVSLAKAIVAAEKYVLAWSGKKREADCDCTEIA